MAVFPATMLPSIITRMPLFRAKRNIVRRRGHQKYSAYDPMDSFKALCDTMPLEATPP
jgi:hypothetical protein